MLQGNVQENCGRPNFYSHNTFIHSGFYLGSHRGLVGFLPDRLRSRLIGDLKIQVRGLKKTGLQFTVRSSQ